MSLPSLASLALDLDAGGGTSAAMTEIALARASDPAGEGARVFTALYRERAPALAAASDAARRAGLVRSPLEGLPISVKDLFDVAGETTRAGSVALDGAPAAITSSPVVRRLLAAGAVLTGRTNMTEFAFSGLGLNPHYGTPRNPFDRATGRIPGGSSSGAAISVTDRMAAAAIGSDTGGSVRIPAALCGLTGFKPTASRVPLDGVLPLSTSLDSIGPLAPTVACCAAVDAVLAGETAPAPLPAAIAGLRFAVPTTVVLDGLDGDVAAAFAASLALLRDLGAQVHEIAMGPFAEVGTMNARTSFAASEAWHWHRSLIERAGELYDPRVIARIRRGAEASAADYLDLQAARAAWIAEVEARLAPFDALLMPTVPIVAPAIGPLEADDALFGSTNLLMLRNPSMINLLDGCALSLPCQRPGEAPVGLGVSAPRGRDRKVLALGLGIEAALAGAGRGALALG